MPGGRPPGIAIAILLGLHGCRDDTDEDMLLVRMGLPGAADDLARTVYKKVKSLHLSIGHHTAPSLFGDEFGAVTGAPGKPMITPLGRWAAGRLPEGLPGLADPGLPVAEMIAEAARFSGRACPGRTWTRASRRSGPPATRMPRDLRGPWRSSPHPLR